GDGQAAAMVRAAIGCLSGAVVGARGRVSHGRAGPRAAPPSRPPRPNRLRLHLQAEIPAAGIVGAARGHAAGALLHRLDLAPPRHAAAPRPSSRRRSSAKTASNIAAVSRPVLVL